MLPQIVLNVATGKTKVYWRMHAVKWAEKWGHRLLPALIVIPLSVIASASAQPALGLSSPDPRIDSDGDGLARGRGPLER